MNKNVIRNSDAVREDAVRRGRCAMQVMNIHDWISLAPTLVPGQKPYTVHMDDSGHFYREPKAFTRTYIGEDERELLEAIGRDYEIIEIN